MFYSMWYNAHKLLPATGRQHRGCIIPQAVTHAGAPEDGRDHRPKHAELIGITNKPLLLYLVGVYIISINDAQSNKYQIYKRYIPNMKFILHFAFICGLCCLKL